MQRQWIWQLKKPLTNTQERDIIQTLANKLQQWETHGMPVTAQFAIRYLHFIVVETETMVSGCSIDWLENTIREIMQAFQLEIASMGDIFFRTADSIEHIPVRLIQDAINSGRISSKTIIFDNSVLHEKGFTHWEVPLANTWLARYLKQESL